LSFLLPGNDQKSDIFGEFFINLSMEMKVDIQFDQLLDIVRQLPPENVARLKAELSAKSSKSDSGGNSTFKDLLLTGPVMNDEQYSDYKALRTRMNQWNKK
jgi:hypothetical protein